jgi:hypothetical protein
LSGRANQDRVSAVNRLKQSGAIGAVYGADIKIWTERLDRCGRKFFSDENDGLGHERVLTRWMITKVGNKTCTNAGNL